MKRWSLMYLFFLIASPARAAESLTASFRLPLDKRVITALASTEVRNFSQESTRPYTHAENTNLDLFFLQMVKKPGSEWQDAALELMLTNNQSLNPVVHARLCPRGVEGVQGCRALETTETRRHHQISQGKISTLGALQLELPNAAHVCLGASANQCDVRLPVYAVQRLLNNQDLQLPRIVTAVTTKSQLKLFDAERGLPFLSLFQFPDPMSLAALGPMKSLSAVHRGLVRVTFANGILHIDPLADRALLIGKKSDIYLASLGSQQTAWQKFEPSRKATQSRLCAGDALDMTESWALFTDCALPLVNGFPLTQGFPLLLNESFKTARLKDSSTLQLASWQVTGSDVVVNEFVKSGDSLKLSSSQSLQFRGKTPDDLVSFNTTLLRRTAWGLYRIGTDSEEKSSLPFSPQLPVVSRNGKSVAIQKNDKDLGCRWYHLTTTDDGFLNWKESGWEFRCHPKLFVNSSESSVAVTQWKEGTVSVHVLSP